MNNIRRSMETLIPMIHTPYSGFRAGPLNTIVGAHVSCPGFGQSMLWGFNTGEIVLVRGWAYSKDRFRNSLLGCRYIYLIIKV